MAVWKSFKTFGNYTIILHLKGLLLCSKIRKYTTWC